MSSLLFSSRCLSLFLFPLYLFLLFLPLPAFFISIISLFCFLSFLFSFFPFFRRFFLFVFLSSCPFSSSVSVLFLVHHLFCVSSISFLLFVFLSVFLCPHGYRFGYVSIYLSMYSSINQSSYLSIPQRQQFNPEALLFQVVFSCSSKVGRCRSPKLRGVRSRGMSKLGM